jgi:hypothetical protein
VRGRERRSVREYTWHKSFEKGGRERVGRFLAKHKRHCCASESTLDRNLEEREGEGEKVGRERGEREREGEGEEEKREGKVGKEGKGKGEGRR